MTQEPSPPARAQLAVSGAIFRDGRLLLVRRAHMPALGVYTLPGGRVEFGESLHQALHREIAEETALQVEIIGLAGWREVLPGPRGGGHYVILSFAACWLAGEPRLNEELDDVLWRDPSNLGDLTTTDGLGDIVRAAQAMLAR